MPRHTARSALQQFLLAVYALARRAGLFETASGRRAFDWAYEAYKKRLEAADVEALQPFVSPAAFVVDVGANVGFFTLRFARWLSPGGRVLAIEPEAANVVRLRRAVAAANLEPLVDVIPAAAAASPGPVFLEINPNHPGDHRLARQGQPVDGVTIDRLIAGHNWTAVSLIKIDVQGAEAAVIAGAHEVLARFRPAIYIEVDDRNLREFGSTAAELCSTLAGYGYAPYRCRSGAFVPLNLDDLFAAAKEGYIDVLFLHDSRTRQRPSDGAAADALSVDTP